MKIHHKLFIPIAAAALALSGCQKEENVELTHYPDNHPVVTIDGTNGKSVETLHATYKNGAMVFDGSMSRTYTVRLLASPKDATVDFELIDSNIPAEYVEMDTTSVTLPAGETTASVTVSLKDEGLDFIKDNHDAMTLELGVKVTAHGYNMDAVPVEAKVVVEKAAYAYITDLTVPADTLLSAGQTFDLASRIGFVPENASNTTLKYASDDESVATVDDKGVVTVLKEGSAANITVSTTDGSEISKVCRVKAIGWYDRSGWTVDTSARYATGNNYVVDGSTGKPQDILDGDASTFLSLVKPGNTYNGCTAAAGDPIYFVVDLKEKRSFSAFRWNHRIHDAAHLRVQEIKISGSDDGTNWTLIQSGISLPTANYTDLIQISIPTSAYRYVKVDYTKWNTTTGSTAQIGEFYLGYRPE
ncbi:MAG: DUF4989 domain-containing protein [Mediterranea sp.]|jgi:hypothetical protein|nr:DUF4989 domain-containing protein [Mediterranea sp.]